MAGPSNNNQVQPAATDISHNKVDAYEVGWLFVQQYFTFLNSSPDRLHCFYSPSCQFVRGTQGEAASACVGQKEIRERIKAYGYSDCKVNISNIDVQSSRGDIIIVHIIGELENKGVTQRFVQLFTLEENANNFSIVNDILRFISSDSSSKASIISSTEADSTPETVTAPVKPAVPVEQASEKAPKSSPAKPSETAKPVASSVTETKDKESTLSANAPAAPTGPKTWANRVASQAAQADQKQAKAPSNTTTPAAKPSPTAGSPQSETKPSTNAPKDNAENTQSHIQLRVKDTVNKKALHEVLSVHGPIVHIELAKGLAFVEFQTAEAASKAIASGKFTVGQETLVPEPRQPSKHRHNAPSNNSQHSHSGSENRRGGSYGSQPRRGHSGAGDAPSPDRNNFEQKGGSYGGSRRGGNHSNGPRNNTRNNRPPAQEGPKQA